MLVQHRIDHYLKMTDEANKREAVIMSGALQIVGCTLNGFPVDNLHSF